MKISEEGLALIKEFEGYSPESYLCPAGLATIGYGHVIRKGEVFGAITEEEAAELLAQDLLYAERVVNENVTAELTQNQFDALVSIVMNVGEGREGGKSGIVRLTSGRPSTLLKKLNAEDYEGAAAEFVKWDMAGGRVVQGLLDRRTREQELFNS